MQNLSKYVDKRKTVPKDTVYFLYWLTKRETTSRIFAFSLLGNLSNSSLIELSVYLTDADTTSQRIASADTSKVFNSPTKASRRGNESPRSILEI